MKNPHFFKAHSRIGLKNVPHRMTEPNIGVEDGPRAILSESFLKQFPQHNVSEFHFTLPEKIQEENFNNIWLEEMQKFYRQIREELKADETQVVVGGEHSISFTSILHTLSRVDPKKLGYIHFDSHPDANLWADSPTENWHGMYMRPFLTTFDLPEIENLVPKKLLPQNFLFIGNLDTDPGERKMIDELEITNIDRDMMRNNPKKAAELIEKLLDRIEFLHINFDIDVFDHTIAPSTSIPTPEGFMKEDIFPLLELLKVFPKIALDQVEVNPKRRGGKETVEVAQMVIKTFLTG